jgi:hypothetical protein
MASLYGLKLSCRGAQGLKEENKQLRAEVDYLKERKPEGAAATRTVTMVTAANGNHTDLEGRLGRLAAEQEKTAAGTAELRTSVIETQRESGQIRQAVSGLETRQSEHEAAVSKALADLAAAVGSASAVETSAGPAAAAPSVDITQQIADITVNDFIKLACGKILPLFMVLQRESHLEWLRGFNGTMLPGKVIWKVAWIIQEKSPF